MGYCTYLPTTRQPRQPVCEWHRGVGAGAPSLSVLVLVFQDPELKLKGTPFLRERVLGTLGASLGDLPSCFWAAPWVPLLGFLTVSPPSPLT